MIGIAYKQAEFVRLVEENASAPPGERLSEAELLIDPEYEDMLDKEGKELCEEVGSSDHFCFFCESLSCTFLRYSGVVHN